MFSIPKRYYIYLWIGWYYYSLEGGLQLPCFCAKRLCFLKIINFKKKSFSIRSTESQVFHLILLEFLQRNQNNEKNGCLDGICDSFIFEKRKSAFFDFKAKLQEKTTFSAFYIFPEPCHSPCLPFPKIWMIKQTYLYPMIFICCKGVGIILIIYNPMKTSR